MTGKSSQADPASRKQKLPKKISARNLRNSGLFYLQRFACSSHQFKLAMRRKIDRSCKAHPELDKEQCEIWLEELCIEFRELGYLNDEAYLRGAIRSLRIGKGLSKSVILMKLKQKGYSSDEIAGALQALSEEENREEDDEYTAALRFAERKKIGPYHPSPPRKTFEQQLSALARGGFSFDICKKIMMLKKPD